jgi:N-acetylmuramoyl-L-alanine amidase
VSRLPPPIRAVLLAFAAVAAHAQAPTPSPTPAPTPHKPKPKSPQYPYNPNIVLLDPAHGGSDDGAKLTDDAVEKDATVALAGKINRGFTVILTHESASEQIAPDQRVEIANRSRASACILLHASSGGHGIHVFSSSLPPATAINTALNGDSAEPAAVLPWGTAQAATLPESQHLASTFADAFYGVRIPLVSGRASVQPIDSLTCPAIALEVAPLPNSDNAPGATPASDDAYQQRVASAIASALSTWRGHIMAQIAGAAMSATPLDKSAPKTAAKATTAPPARKPRPADIPVESPTVGPLPTPAPEKAPPQ